MLFTIIFVALGQVSWGQTEGDYMSKVSGDWSSNSSWKRFSNNQWIDTDLTGEDYPYFESNVKITNGNIITLSTSGTVKQLTIENGGTLVISGSNTLTVYGNFINDGIFNPGNGSTVRLGGTISQNIGGLNVTNFWNLSIDNSSIAVSANKSFNVFYNMTINNNCTFIPDATVEINNDLVNLTSTLINPLTKVTHTGQISGDFLKQYNFKNYSISTVEFIGISPQVIDPYSGYPSIIINNPSECSLSGEAKCTNLTISNGALTVNYGGKAFCTNLTIANGKLLTVNSGGFLSVFGTTTLNSNQCLVLKSNATLTGTFSHSDLFSGNGSIMVERYMSIAHPDRWHLYCSPVQNQSIHDFLKTNPQIPDLYDPSLSPPNDYKGVGMRDYNTTGDQWNDYFNYEKNSYPDLMGNSKGYIIRGFNDDNSGTGIIYATGIPNLNTVIVTLKRSTAATDKGWNCIGNPFTSAINIKNSSRSGPGFLNSVNIAKLEPGYTAVYIWDSSNSKYEAVNNITSITGVQMGQGFFVKSIIGGGDVSFNKEMQNLVSAELTFKVADLEWPSINILAQNQAFKSSTEIKFVTNTTKGLDPGYDAGMLKSNPDFALYSKLLEDNDVDFTLQCLPDQNYDQYVIPIGIDCKVASDITFTAETVNLPSGCQALLEDRLTKRFTRLDLKDAKYTATVCADTKGTGRFYLHTSDVISGDQPIEKEQFKINTIGKTVYINGEVSNKANFFVYSVNGKLLANFKAQSLIQNQFDASRFPAGVYIITVDDQNQKKSVKFVIEN